MNRFTTSELASMQATQESAMQDSCFILTYSASIGTNGEPIASYSTGSEIFCGVNMTAGRETWRKDATVENIDATIRLPIGTVLKAEDRIQITKRFGVAVTMPVFEIIGEVRRGPSGLQVDVKVVQL